jgi:hypothetical protein
LRLFNAVENAHDNALRRVPVEGDNFAAPNQILPAEWLHCRRDFRGKLIEGRLVDDFDLSDAASWRGLAPQD